MEFPEEKTWASRKFLFWTFSTLILTGCLNGTAIAQGESASQGARLAAAVNASLSDSSAPGYRSAFVDLNNDSEADAIVLMTSQSYCGSGGCTLLVFHGSPEGFKLLSRSTISREPIYVLSVSNAGWRSLGISVAGGGISPHVALMAFSGDSYPLNPTTQPEIDVTSLTEAIRLELQ